MKTALIVSSTIFGGVALLKEVCGCGWPLRFQMITPGLLSLCLPAA